MKIEIREILMKDNDRVKEVLVNVMKEFGVPDHGTALQLSLIHISEPTRL